MKKIMHIVGNRPQFIKLAPVSRELRSRGFADIIVHTGQHFDQNMSDIFFEELDIPEPDENLHISGGTHAQMTANMMIALEPVIAEYTPDIVMVYGDTNSTLAAALTAKKMEKVVAHVEAGGRTGSESNPEEINRQVVDRISDLLFAADRSSYDNLVGEGLGERAYLTGDVMLDAFKYYQNTKVEPQFMDNIPQEYVLMTWHRAENTGNMDRMKFILDFISRLSIDVLCPMHPRTVGKLKEFGLWETATSIPNFKIIDPVGYIQMISLTSNAKWILTDSGGLSKESYFAGRRCLFMVDLRVWPELIGCKWILPMDDNMEAALSQVEEMNVVPEINEHFFGEGKAASEIADIIDDEV